MSEKNIVYASPLLLAALLDKAYGPFEHLVWDNNDDYKYEPEPANKKGKRIPNALEKNKSLQKMISDWSDKNFKDHDEYIDFLLSDETKGKKNYFTDDTTLTMAVAYTLNSDKYRAIFDEIKNKNVTDEKKLRELYKQLDEDLFVNFCKFSRRYTKSFGECGSAFQKLVIKLSKHNNQYISDDEIREAYRAKKETIRSKDYKGRDTKSWGNGSAMRVSSCAYVANSLTEARVLAELSAINTHESDIGIKGAQAVASFIYLARLGLDKKTIKAYMNYMYRTENPVCVSGNPAESFITTWDFDSLTIDKIKEKGYPYCIRCDLTVIPAIVAVLEADNYLDACKLVSKLGADSDTMGLITASMAAALYGTPEILIEKGKDQLKEIQHKPDVVINGQEDNSGTKDNLMFKINEDFDKNFSSGYRGNADKNWQLSQIDQILDDLETQNQNLSEIDKTKKKDLENLVKLMNTDANKIENKIIDDRKDKENQSDYVNKKSALTILRGVDRKLYRIGEEISTEDNKKKLDEVISLLVSFVDNFDMELSKEEKEKLKQEIKSKKDVSWVRAVVERIKIFFLEGKAIDNEKGKIIAAKQKLNENRKILKQFFMDKNDKNKKDEKDETEKTEYENKNKTKEIRKDKDRE